MKAIIVTYSEDQNCPSRPESTLYDLPADRDERDRMLYKLFYDLALDCEDEDCTLTIEEHTQYGDLVVCHEEYGVYMYVTYVTD